MKQTSPIASNSQTKRQALVSQLRQVLQQARSLAHYLRPLQAVAPAERARQGLEPYQVQRALAHKEKTTNGTLSVVA